MEDKYDIILKKKFGCFFNYKLFLLPISIIMPSMLYFSIFQNDYYIFLSVFISLLVITWNFPYLSKFSYTRPIYFEDLNDDNNSKVRKKILYNMELSKKFKNRFIIFQQFILSITIAIVVEYISFKYRNGNYQPLEFLGYIGGILSLYTKFIRYFGKGVLVLLYHMKRKEKEKLLIKLNVKPSSSFTNLHSINNESLNNGSINYGSINNESINNESINNESINIEI